ncbi:unnamed protein product [Lymnaea stagnalis]|uniref:AIG1-type G domain-containing protein n=1 Tax=Lymnaea stagnalis TaxID=6523 RepID=A0AAV2HCZ2_LYMST
MSFFKRLFMKPREKYAEEKDDPNNCSDSTLNYLLIGKAGNGKSSSGNSLVGETVFKSFDASTAGTKFVYSYKTKRFGKEMCVVDTPGLHDTELQAAIENARFARKYMTKAFKVCPEGFHAMLIVLNITNKYTAEDNNVIELLTDIFGEVMFDYTILIFTRGDNFDNEHHLCDADRSQEFFKYWCKQQADDLGELLKKCQYRAVLFHNTDTYELQRDVELLALDIEMKKISGKRGLYTERTFQLNEHRRIHLILNKYQPELEKEIDEKLLTLKKELQLIKSDGAKITEKAIEALEAINNHDSKYPTLDTVKEAIEILKNNFGLEKTNQEKFHLTTKVQEIIDGPVLLELRSLSDVIDNIRNPEKHKEELKNKARALSRYIEEEALGTDWLDNWIQKVKMLLLEIDDLDTKGTGTLIEYR